jgi:hypothetical protein
MTAPEEAQPGMCEHPTGSLAGVFEPPWRLTLTCRACGETFDQDGMPLEMLERVTRAIAAGAKREILSIHRRAV